jgi:hypothetical protein
VASDVPIVPTVEDLFVWSVVEITIGKGRKLP